MEYYTAKEVAELLEVSLHTVRVWMHTGKLDAERYSGRGGNKISDSHLNDLFNLPNFGKYRIIYTTNLSVREGGDKARHIKNTIYELIKTQDNINRQIEELISLL